MRHGIYAATVAPVNGVCPGTNDRFLYSTGHCSLGEVYHYFGRFEPSE